MLTQAENDRLCRVTGDAPMGQMMRRYWLPACWPTRSPRPTVRRCACGCSARTSSLFRDTAGRLGFIDAHCPHRLASLALGRNEEGGLRCIYHGWKFDVAGRCVEMPTEPEAYDFRDRMTVRSYPIVEAGGMSGRTSVPPERRRAFPRHDWTDVPATHYTVRQDRLAHELPAGDSKVRSTPRTRGSCIAAATSRATGRRARRSRPIARRSSKPRTRPTGSATRRSARPNVNPDTEKYVRVTLFQMPSTAFIPRSIDANTEVHVQIFVPVDDENSIFYGVFFSQNGQPVRDLRASLFARRGIDLDDNYYRLANEANGWQQDRPAMKSGESWCGIEGFPNQDIACQESMGPIVDRSLEHLGTSDVAIIRMRRRMLDAVGRFQKGEPLIGHDPSIPYERLRSEQKVIPIDAPWQQVGAYAGEYAAR